MGISVLLPFFLRFDLQAVDPRVRFRSEQVIEITY